MGVLTSQYKDPYKPTSIMESRRVSFAAHLNPSGVVTGTYCDMRVAQSPHRSSSRHSAPWYIHGAAFSECLAVSGYHHVLQATWDCALHEAWKDGPFHKVRQVLALVGKCCDTYAVWGYGRLQGVTYLRLHVLIFAWSHEEHCPLDLGHVG